MFHFSPIPPEVRAQTFRCCVDSTSCIRNFVADCASSNSSYATIFQSAISYTQNISDEVLLLCNNRSSAELRPHAPRDTYTSITA